MNSLNTRWNRGDEGARTAYRDFDSLTQEEKFNLNFKEVIEAAECPDAVFILESKLTLEKLLKIKGFDEWRKSKGYAYVSAVWSQSTRNKAGYAGVVLLSKSKPLRLKYDFSEQDPAFEGRAITAYYATMTIIGVYSQCSGYDNAHVVAKRKFDKALRRHCNETKIDSGGNPVVLAGDLNVNPYDSDYHPNAFKHMLKQKELHNAKHDPGCSPEERRAYDLICKEFEGVNAWEKLNPGVKQDTWHNLYLDRKGDKKEGQRIDHYVCSQELFQEKRAEQVASMAVLQGYGSSDHWPILLEFKKNGRNRHNERKSIKALRKEGYYEGIIEQTVPICGLASMKKQKISRISDVVGMPVFKLTLMHEGLVLDDQDCFLDTGSQFTIYNPPKNGSLESDPLFKAYKNDKSPNAEGCALVGVGGGVIVAARALRFQFRIGRVRCDTDALILSEHEPTLPRLLLGMKTMMRDFKGEFIYPDLEGGPADLRCRFGADIEHEYRGKGIHKPKACSALMPADLLLDEINEDKLDESFKAIVAATIGQTTLDELVRDEEAEQYQGEYSDTIVARKCPAFCLNFETENKENFQAEALIDEGDDYNYISARFLEELELNGAVREGESTLNGSLIRRGPSPSGVMTENEKTDYVQLKVHLPDKTSRVVNCLISQSDVELVLSAKALNNEGAVDWSSRKWVIDDKRAIAFEDNDVVPYAPLSIPLRAKKTIMMPPRSLGKFEVEAKGALTRGYIIAPAQKLQCDVAAAWGPCDEPTWCQLINFSREYTKIKKGQVIARLFRTSSLQRDALRLQKIDMSYDEPSAKGSARNGLSELLARTVPRRKPPESRSSEDLKGALAAANPDDARKSQNSQNPQKRKPPESCNSEDPKGGAVAAANPDDAKTAKSQKLPASESSSEDRLRASPNDPIDSIPESLSGGRTGEIPNDLSVYEHKGPGMSAPKPIVGRCIVRSLQKPEDLKGSSTAVANPDDALGVTDRRNTQTHFDARADQNNCLSGVNIKESSKERVSIPLRPSDVKQSAGQIDSLHEGRRQVDAQSVVNGISSIKQPDGISSFVVEHCEIEDSQLTANTGQKNNPRDVCSESVSLPVCDDGCDGLNPTVLTEMKRLKMNLKQTKIDRKPEEVAELAQWVVDYKQAISPDGVLDLSAKPSHDFKFEIVLTEPNPMWKSHTDKFSPQQKSELTKQVEEKLKQRIIEKSSAPWSSNCILINKDGKTRIAVDYRKLNSFTQRDCYKLPVVQEILDVLANKKWFTSVDCCQAYHQIPIPSERDRNLTTFSVPGGGLYRYRFMPFGVKNGGAVWSRFIDHALEGLRWNICAVYADDILITTESPDVKDHIRDLSLVFDRLLKYGIKVKGPKMRLGVKELPFLGTIIGVNGCRPDPEKTKAITELPVPSNVHHLRRFLGMASYYRKYIPNFADIAYPLYSLAKKNAKLNRNANKEVELDADALKAFQDLKNALTTEPVVLHYPHWDKPFEVHVDASDYGLGAVLVQKVDGEEKVVMYASRLQNNDEVKYGIYQKEALAMVWAIELFSHYLHGVRFTVVTDCRGLVYIKNNSTVAKIARWILRLQEFDFEVRHRAGKLAVVPDELSREPLKDTNPYAEETVENLYKKGNNSLFDEDGNTFLDKNTDDTEDCEDEKVVRTLTRSKTKADKSKNDLDAKDEKVEKGEEVSENKLNSKSRAPAAKPLESCLKKAGPAALEKKPVAFKGKIAEDIIDKDSEGESLRRDGWSAADVLERASAFTENKEKKRLDEASSIAKKRKTYFFGESADMAAWTTAAWVQEQSTKESLTEMERMEREGIPLRKNESGIAVKTYIERRKTGQRESFETRELHKIYVPPTLRKFILEQHHNLPLHGHQGATKLTRMIGQRYFWPGMRADALRYTNACWDCVRRKTTRNMNLGLTEPALAKRPWETVAIDFVGKCKTSDRGNCWILTIIDCFSRYPILVPLPDRKSETVAKALYEHLICQHGCPKKILSDRAKEFISAGIQEVYDRFGIKMVTTAGYSPSANGVCERFHRWLNAAMTIIWKKKALDWDDYLPPIAFAYRASTNESTGYSPYYLVHGHDPILPLDALLDIEENKAGAPTEEIVATTVQRLKDAFRTAREQQYRAYLKNYEMTQNKVKPEFKKDDWIIIYKRSAKEARLDITGDKRTLPRKWTNQWVGPGRFIREISNTEAEVSVYGERLVIGYSRLARYRPWDGEWSVDGSSTSSLFFENEDRKIEEIEQDEPEVGDMFVVLWGQVGWPDGIIKADFGVGRITKINDNPEAKYDCHWFGNYSYVETKAFMPGFVDTDRKIKFYNSKIDKRYFTNHDTSVDLTADMIVCFGDDVLDSSGMLTRKTKEKLQAYRDYFYSDH